MSLDASELSVVAAGPAGRTLSPALRGFQLNPFRIFRLGVTATTSEAARSAEQVLTLARVGLSPDEPDPLPWQPAADLYELQQAAQTVEEPLRRLNRQMFWFDTIHDPQAPLLEAALADPDQPALPEYLAQETALPEASADPAPAYDRAAVAHAVNQANLRLLLAAGQFSGIVLPLDEPSGERRIAASDWQSHKEMAVLPDAHRAFTADSGEADPGAEAARNWAGALTRWVRILSHPFFRFYLEQCVADLLDDFVTADDVDTIEESVRAHLADLSAQEARFLLLDGRYAAAGALIDAVAGSGLGPRVLLPAMRPLHYLFDSEIAELKLLFNAPEEDQLASIEAYLKRLAVIRGRWAALDKPGLVGLLDIVDQAVEQGYLRMRQLDKRTTKLAEVAKQSGEIATSRSLRERISGFRRELEEARTRLCHFCKDNPPDYDRSVVLHGKKETQRTHSWNTTTIHYALRYAIVLRCTRCARFHQFIKAVGVGVVVLLLSAIVLLVVGMFAAR